MILTKFGGKVLKSPEGFNKTLEIIKKFSREKLYIIISAFGSTTTILENIAQNALNHNIINSEKWLNNLINYHKDLANNVLKPSSLSAFLDFIDEKSSEIRKILRGINITNELTAKTLDRILSYGELFALFFMDLYLKENGICVKVIDSRDFIITNENHNYAKPLYKEITKKFKNDIFPLIQNNNIFLTQGFVARSKSGNITTMGKESSNLTASIIANLVNAEQIYFYTDVEGIFSTDPKIVANATPINTLSYENAYFLAKNGLKLIHPSMVYYLKKNNISAIYCSPFNLNGFKTEIKNCSDKIFLPTITFSENLYYFKDIKGIINNNTSKNPKDLEKIKGTKFLQLDETNIFLSQKELIHRNIYTYNKICCVNIDIDKINTVLKNFLKEDDITIINYKIYDNVITKLLVPTSLTFKIINEIHKEAFS